MKEELKEKLNKYFVDLLEHELITPDILKQAILFYDIISREGV